MAARIAQADSHGRRKMAQKTIRLGVFYSLHDGAVFTFDEDFNDVETKYKVGRKVVLGSSYNFRHKTECWFVSFNLAGIEGTTRGNFKTEGWRGQYNDESRQAHGIHKIKKIRQLKNGDIAVTVAPSSDE
jgi:hypothetical protein